MQDYCDNCNGKGYVREGYDGEAPCEICNHDNYESWVLDQWRQSENDIQRLKTENERLKLIISTGEKVVNDACNQADARLHAEVEAEKLRNESLSWQQAFMRALEDHTVTKRDFTTVKLAHDVLELRLADLEKEYNSEVETATALGIYLDQAKADNDKLRTELEAAERMRKECGKNAERILTVLSNLLDACYQADEAGELYETIDGSLLDAAKDVLDTAKMIEKQKNEHK